MFLFKDLVVLCLLKDVALDDWVDSGRMEWRREQMANVNGGGKKDKQMVASVILEPCTKEQMS